MTLERNEMSLTTTASTEASASPEAPATPAKTREIAAELEEEPVPA